MSPPPATETSLCASVRSAATLATAFVPASKGSISKAPNGPFQTSVLAAVSTASDFHHRARPDVEDHVALPDMVDRHHVGMGVRLEFLRDDRIDRQNDLAFGRMRRRDDRARGRREILFAERPADLLALGEQERIGHGAADDQEIDLAR